MTWTLFGQGVSLDSDTKYRAEMFYHTGINQGDAGNQPVAAEVVKERHGGCQNSQRRVFD
jgi:hypothetical protein